MADFLPIDVTSFYKPAQAEAGIAQTMAQTQNLIALAREHETDARLKAKQEARMDEFQRRIAGASSPAAVAATSNAAAASPIRMMGVDVPDAATESGLVTPQPISSDITAALKKPPMSVADTLENQGYSLLQQARMADELGLGEEANKRRDDGKAALTDAAKLRKEEQDTQKASWERAYDLASGITDAGSFNYVLNQLNKEKPGMADQLGFKKDTTGNYVWDNDAAQKVLSIRDLALSQKDRIAAQQRAQELVLRKQELDRKTEKDAEIARLHDEMIAARQQGLKIQAEALDARIQALQATMTQRDRVFQENVTKNIQTRLDQNTAVKAFPQYETAYTNANSVAARLQADPKMKETTAVDTDVLKKAYTAMAEGFRNRTGGKWEDANVAKFNGLLQNTDKWIRSIGQGTPAVSREVAITMAKNMEDMYAIAGAESLKSEMVARRAARQRGGDPEGLQYRAFGNRQLVELLASKNLLTVTKKDPSGKALEIKLGGKTFDVSKEGTEE